MVELENHFWGSFDGNIIRVIYTNICCNVLYDRHGENAKKDFYGCGGLEMTDEIRLTIAGQACLLLVGRGWQVYPGLMSVLVYPSAFMAQREQRQEDGTVSHGDHHLLGESWSNGKVILSWDDVTSGGRDFHDGHNVVLHEFAHQLDGLSGATNGAPPLGGVGSTPSHPCSRGSKHRPQSGRILQWGQACRAPRR